MSRCREVTKLISDSLERELTFWEYWDLRIHVVLCGICRRFQANVLRMREMLKSESVESESDLMSQESRSMKLSQNAKTRIRAAMEELDGI